ncbi:hypothetical protein EVAR_2807_1 [Eumeta japonica]|uniref:Uncharacterized protein n=1 Tax=Eumeta variegata TaxID=151549 RepID=A0A4C1SZS3_EUMVA|nr:hypothetical protein EVAR_2807_1 [Eumeta japonica]
MRRNIWCNARPRPAACPGAPPTSRSIEIARRLQKHRRSAGSGDFYRKMPTACAVRGSPTLHTNRKNTGEEIRRDNAIEADGRRRRQLRRRLRARPCPWLTLDTPTPVRPPAAAVTVVRAPGVGVPVSKTVRKVCVNKAPRDGGGPPASPAIIQLRIFKTRDDALPSPPAPVPRARVKALVTISTASAKKVDRYVRTKTKRLTITGTVTAILRHPIIALSFFTRSRNNPIIPRQPIPTLAEGVSTQATRFDVNDVDGVINDGAGNQQPSGVIRRERRRSNDRSTRRRDGRGSTGAGPRSYATRPRRATVRHVAAAAPSDVVCGTRQRL